MKNKKSKNDLLYTSAGIRTRVRALATPGDDRYTTDVMWCPDPDSNRGQLPLQGSALPLSYLGKQINLTTYILLHKTIGFSTSCKRSYVKYPNVSVGPLRFELRTSAMSRRRHNRLDHEPVM